MIWLVQNIIISIIIIILIHYLFNYLKDTYTTKKTKDLVKTQTDKYKTILDEIMNKKSEGIENMFIFNSENMQNELDSYLEQELSVPTL
jgi:ABC-type cobalt transport system substrate-binding protein